MVVRKRPATETRPAPIRALAASSRSAMEPPISLALVVARLLRCHRCVITVVRPDGDAVVDDVAGVCRGFSVTACAACEATLAAHVAGGGEPLIVNDPTADGPHWGLAGPYATLPSISVPVRLPDGAVAVITATDREQRTPFGAEDVALLEYVVTLHTAPFDLEARRRLQSLRAEMRRVRADAIRAGEEERRRIARDLHDQAGHALTAAILKLTLLSQTLDDAAPVRRALDGACQTLTESAELLGGVAFNLRPRLLEDLGLVPALRSLTRRVAADAAVETDLRILGEERRLAADVELAAFRIAQEATTNALKHAEPRRIVVDLTFAERGIELAVADDGGGFDPARLVRARDRGGQGLLGMRERSDLVGGVFELNARPGDGTTVRVWLPEHDDA